MGLCISKERLLAGISHVAKASNHIGIQNNQTNHIIACYPSKYSN